MVDRKEGCTEGAQAGRGIRMEVWSARLPPSAWGDSRLKYTENPIRNGFTRVHNQTQRGQLWWAHWRVSEARWKQKLNSASCSGDRGQEWVLGHEPILRRCLLMIHSAGWKKCATDLWGKDSLNSRIFIRKSQISADKSCTPEGDIPPKAQRSKREPSPLRWTASMLRMTISDASSVGNLGDWSTILCHSGWHRPRKEKQKIKHLFDWHSGKCRKRQCCCSNVYHVN